MIERKRKRASRRWFETTDKIRSEKLQGYEHGDSIIVAVIRCTTLPELNTIYLKRAARSVNGILFLPVYIMPLGSCVIEVIYNLALL